MKSSYTTRLRMFIVLVTLFLFSFTKAEGEIGVRYRSAGSIPGISVDASGNIVINSSSTDSLIVHRPARFSNTVTFQEKLIAQFSSSEEAIFSRPTADTVRFMGTGGSFLEIEDNNVNLLDVESDGDLNFDVNTLFIDVSTNQVGFGTNLPTEKLHVLQDADNGVTLFRADAAITGSEVPNYFYTNQQHTTTSPFVLIENDHVSSNITALVVDQDGGADIAQFQSDALVHVTFQEDGDVIMGAASADDIQPAFSIIGDADSDAADDTDDTFKIALTPNATPTSATWDFSTTQARGFQFNKPVIVDDNTDIRTGISGKLMFNDSYFVFPTSLNYSFHLGGVNRALQFYGNATFTQSLLYLNTNDVTINFSGNDLNTTIEASGVDSAFVIDGTQGNVYMEGLASGTGTALSRVAGTNAIVEETSLAFFKDNIRPTSFDPYQVLALQLRDWEWNEHSANEGETDWGFVTEEVSAVSNRLISGNTWSPKKVVAALTQVVREQQDQINALKAEIRDKN